MADRETSFLARWSRRKRDPDQEPDPTAEPDEVEPGRAEVPALQGDREGDQEGDEEADEDAGDPEVIAKLPDIESLDETSDFAPFMAEGVPEILRRRALRKLWRLNPVFANLDGLAEYDEDFTDAANLLSEIKTVYKVGKGMVDKEAAQKTAEETAQKAAEETAGETAGETAASEGAAEPAPAQSQLAQLAESTVGAPAVEHPVSDLAADTSESVSEDQPADAAESLPLPEADEEGEAVTRKPADPPQRSAMARRWGEPSE